MVVQHSTDKLLGQLGEMRREFSEGVICGREEGEIVVCVVEEVDERFVLVNYFGEIGCVFA